MRSAARCTSSVLPSHKCNSSDENYRAHTTQQHSMYMYIYNASCWFMVRCVCSPRIYFPLLSNTAAHRLRGRIQKHIFGRLCNGECALQNVHPGTKTFTSIQMSHILVTILLCQESLHRTMEQPCSVSSEHGCSAGDAKICSHGFHKVPI